MNRRTDEQRTANGEWRMANENLDLQIMFYARRGGLPVCRKYYNDVFMPRGGYPLPAKATANSE